MVLYECYWLLYPMKLVANLQGILYIIHPNDGKIEGKHRSGTWRCTVIL